MPVTALRKSAPIYNGAWVFTDRSHRHSWQSNNHVFMPRLGLAMRINDKTALRVGWARFVLAPLLMTDTLGSARYPGYAASTTVAPVLQGIPGARISDPFPSSHRSSCRWARLWA